MAHITFEQALSTAFAHIGAAVDIFQSIPRPNGATTAALSNGRIKAKALAPQKVKKAALKALPPAPETPAVVAATPSLAKGPKKAKAKAAAKAKPVKAKAAPKAKAAAKPAKAAKVSKAIVKAKADKPVKAKAAPANAIAAGRRAVASGERPKLHDAVAIVMGKETLTAGVILERLKERGWEPGASNPQSYISYTLSDNGETFKRGKRGEYSVISPKSFEKVAAQFKGGKSSGKAERVASTDAGEAEATATASEPEVQAETVEAAPEASAAAGDPPTSTPTAVGTTETDTALADLGLGQSEIGANPFDA